MTRACVRGISAAIACLALSPGLTQAEDAKIETGFVTKSFKNADGHDTIIR